MAERKQATNDEVLQQLHVLQTQIHDLQQQIANQNKSSAENLSIKFLLAEFNELGEFWRHTDSRLENSLNLYLTGSAVVVSAIVFLSQQIADVRLLLLVAIFVSLALFIIGVILARRILGTALIKAEYIHALNLIRRFFVDKDAGITPYLFLPFADSPADSSKSSGKTFRPRIPANLLVAIHVWNGLLLGFSVSVCVWLIVPTLPVTTIIATGVVVAAICIGWLGVTARQEVRKRTNSFESRHRRIG
ncbi:MAG TPA: hypothetical protein ENI49_05070 [Thermoplasmatales archaeon]|nr:hypothetical protein [Thermoplasmatales archaeon]